MKKRIIVEICSTERLDVPVGNDKNIFCKKDHIDLLVSISNEIFNKSNNKLEKLRRELKKDLSTDKSTDN